MATIREKGLPEIPPKVVWRPSTFANEVPHRRSARPGEWLARRTTGDQSDAELLDQLAGALDDVLVAEIPVDAEAGVVGTVGLQGVVVMIHAKNHVEPGFGQSEAQSAGTTEEVDRQGAFELSPIARRSVACSTAIG